MGDSAPHFCGYVTLDSPASADGSAISAIRLRVESEQAVDTALAELGWAPLAVGGIRLSGLLGIDRGLVIRWSPTTIHITPHGGALITSRLLAAFSERGFTPESSRHFSMDCYPEAADLIEACALDAIASSHSPMAIDVIMRQVNLWRAPAQNLTAPNETEIALNRLLHPPRIVLLGAPNIGKSTLTNALAGRMVSLVADEPGVTRDHVGVCLELDGLSVLWIDAPGVADHAPTDIDRAAQEIAAEAAATADLVLLCGDATCPAPTGGAHGGDCRGPVLRVGLRADLGLLIGADLCVSARDRSSLERLAIRIRQLLVPDPDLTCPSRWRFHRALPAS